ncbi:MAG: hypothetical protein JWM53_6790, partial [bacterium]|nr:hypothetical protein [bacterium]
MTNPRSPSFVPRTSLERRLQRTMLLPLALTVLLGAALVGELLLLLNRAGWIDRTDQVIAQTHHVGVLLAERSAALDRYLAGSADEQLPSLHQHEQRIRAEVGKLGLLVADNPAQEARRRQLLDAITSWSESVEQLLARRNSGVRLWDRVLQQRRLTDMQRIYRQLDEFMDVEEQLRDDRSRRTHQLSRAVIAATVFAALLLGGVLGLFARRQLRAAANEYEAALAHSREQALLLSEEERFRRLIEAVEDYAIFLLDADGNVASWNAGAERGTGWRADEILGQPFDVFFTRDDRTAGRPQRELAVAAGKGAARGEERRVRKDGSEFLAEVTLTAVRDPSGQLAGFASIARDVTERRRDEAAIDELNTELEQRVAELAAANGELEAFSYSVSHDLRGPLRAIDGFSKILMEDYRDRLDAQGQHYLGRVRAGSQRMGQLIDDLLSLAGVTRAEMHRTSVELTQLAREVVEELRRQDPARVVEVTIADTSTASGDPR